MRYAVASVALAALAAANPVPQGVTSAVYPSTSAPSGCVSSYSGTFEIEVVNVTKSASKRQLLKRADLVLTLSDGILKDAEGRTGYIASNNQFQFDKPPQDGAIYTAGWSICPNMTLAIGDDAIFDECLSGTFYNLYDEATSAQCSPVYIEVIDGSGSATTATTAAASEMSDGQITATPVSQISDGQIQATTGSPVTQISDGQIQATTGSPVTQISDGQIQATTGAAVTQISDGQIQATTGSPVTQISDGQIQATTAAAVSQISDGQVQAATNGTTYASPSATVQAYTGAAALPTMRAELFGLAAAGFAVVML